MAAEDAFVQEFLFQKHVFIPFLIFVAIYLLVRYYYDNMYAMVMTMISAKLASSKFYTATKSTLFATMKGNSTVVEVGAGTGTNFGFYPSGCAVTCVEPKVTFEGYVSGTVKQNGKHLESVKFVEGVAESLSSLLEENSVDYVVCTLVMCSVKDMRKTVEEIKKILKPGGTFYFLEHVHAPVEHRMSRLIQWVVTLLFRRLADNCHWNREPWIALEAAGYTRLDYQRRVFPKASVFSPLKHFCVGSATK